jgi:hypothetical protein
MWHSSPSPKYSRTSSGHMLASASSSGCRVARVDAGADLLDHVVRLAQVLVAGAVALDQVGDGVEPEAVDAHVQPEAHVFEHRLEHAGLSKLRSGWWLKKRCQ